MLAIEAGTLLTRLARGGEVDLAPGEETTLASFVAAGRIALAPDPTAEAAALERARGELAALIGLARPAPDRTAREKALRTQILDLVEKVSRAQGAATVRGTGGGPYRAGASQLSYVVTFQARSLLSDLAPRLGRVGRMSLADFRAHMDTLREVLAHRARRTHALLSLMQARAPVGSSAGAVRSAAVGLAARNEPEREVAATWIVLVQGLTNADERDGTGRAEWTGDQEIAAAEGVLLATRDLGTLGVASAAEVHRQRLELLRTHSAGHAEDALDATILLAGSRAEIPEATQLAVAARGYGAPLTLTGALVLRASRAIDKAALVGQLRGQLAAASEGADENERTAAAVLLALGGHDPTTLVQRARDLRAYLTRFSPSGMLVPAALLALLPTELAETLDLLRMTSTELQKQKLGAGGGESLTLAIKLLLATALLARGAEGDPEERAGFVRFDDLALAQLGVAGLASQVPLTLAGLTAFHRPALDATLYYQEQHQPTHSSYVFGSGRSSGWG